METTVPEYESLFRADVQKYFLHCTSKILHEKKKSLNLNTCLTLPLKKTEADVLCNKHLAGAIQRF